MDLSAELQSRVVAAHASGNALHIVGGNSKSFYGRNPSGITLDVKGNRGVLNYQPGELTLTARGGTPMREIAELLDTHDQMLPFEPPSFSDEATLAGTIACGLSGPRRPWTGAVRDYLLGVRILTGAGKDMRIGAPVMKNVAGYDLFRPMAGAMGTLGILLEIIIKVLPKPRHERSFSIHCDAEEAVRLVTTWQKASVPLSGACYSDGTLNIRLSGDAQSVETSAGRLDASIEDIDNSFWHDLNEQRLSFFIHDTPLYRLTLPATAHLPAEFGNQIIDWGGRQRWLQSDLSLQEIQRKAEELGGHASVFRNGDREAEVFHPLPAPLINLEQRIRSVLDPSRILNPGRLYKDL